MCLSMHGCSSLCMYFSFCVCSYVYMYLCMSLYMCTCVCTSPDLRLVSNGGLTCRRTQLQESLFTSGLSAQFVPPFFLSLLCLYAPPCSGVRTPSRTLKKQTTMPVKKRGGWALARRGNGHPHPGRKWTSVGWILLVLGYFSFFSSFFFRWVGKSLQ